MSKAVRYERQGHIGQIVLDRPDNRNSMTPELLGAFAEASAQAKDDKNARCIVIVGEGRCFSAGADFKATLQLDGGLPHERSFAMYKPFLSVREIEVPVIGALNGHAVGGGFGLALMADIRIASETSKYGANFAKLGLHSGMGISYVLPRLVGVSRAAEMLFTGKLVTGAEAAAMGLVSEAVPADDVLPRALALAEDIAGAAPLALKTIKHALYDGLEWNPARAARREAALQAESLATADAKEGMAALLEKRAPNFEGR